MNFATCDPMLRDASGRYPLHVAAKEGNILGLRQLLSKGVDASATSFSGRTALHEAVVVNNLEAAKFLIRGGCNATIADENGSTALHLATRNGSAELAWLLVRAGCDPNVVSSYEDYEDGQSHWIYQNALGMAVQYGNASVVNCLLNRCSVQIEVPGPGYYSPMNMAALRGDHQILRILLDKDGFCLPSIVECDDGPTALHHLLKEDAEAHLTFLANRSQRLESLSILLEHGCNQDAKDYDTTPLHLAALNNNAAAVQLLLDHGCDVECCGSQGTCWQIATTKQYRSVLMVIAAEV